jgi:hypothetical protein
MHSRKDSFYYSLPYLLAARYDRGKRADLDIRFGILVVDTILTAVVSTVLRAGDIIWVSLGSYGRQVLVRSWPRIRAFYRQR